MTNTLWDHAYQYFSAQQAIYLKFKALDFEQQIALLCPQEGQNAETPTIVSLLDLRDEVATNLQTLIDSISSLLAQEHRRYVVDALAFYCDETVLTQYITQINVTQETLEHLSRASVVQKLSAFWPKLQMQFCQCHNGGELFFTNLHTILSHPDTFRFALEIYLLCLKQGFVGRYLQHNDMLEHYQSQCLKVLTPLANQSVMKQARAQSRLKNEPMLGEHHASSI